MGKTTCACVVGVSLLTLASCSHPVPETTHAASPGSDAVQPKRDIRLSGIVEAIHSSKVLVPQIWGSGGPVTLTKLIANGVKVKEGDLIAVFDNTQQIDQARN